jgi:hypothetical protein
MQQPLRVGPRNAQICRASRKIPSLWAVLAGTGGSSVRLASGVGRNWPGCGKLRLNKRAPGLIPFPTKRPSPVSHPVALLSTLLRPQAEPCSSHSLLRYSNYAHSRSLQPYKQPSSITTLLSHTKHTLAHIIVAPFSTRETPDLSQTLQSSRRTPGLSSIDLYHLTQSSYQASSQPVASQQTNPPSLHTTHQQNAFLPATHLLPLRACRMRIRTVFRHRNLRINRLYHLHRLPRQHRHPLRLPFRQRREPDVHHQGYPHARVPNCRHQPQGQRHLHCAAHRHRSQAQPHAVHRRSRRAQCQRVCCGARCWCRVPRSVRRGYE